ncbi:MAG: HlyD family type I secretion periplasmic adaptor subunit [Pseudomonadota bacterium]|nr:HlyD family type I secretion periplasmic adaptor subunit [Pseudomonadota bacterium]
MNQQLPVVVGESPPALAESYDERARGRTKIAAIMAAVLGVVVLFGLILVPIGGAVIATAEVAPETRIKRVAHPTGGVIADILVSDGDEVSEGDVLIRFDTEVSEVRAEFSERSLAQLIAQRARLTAEVENRDSIRFPAELLADESDEARSAMAAERRRFSLNRAEQTSLRGQLVERVNQLERQVDGYNAQISSLEQQQALIVPELEMLREMHGKGYVTIRRLNEMERTAIDLAGNIGALRANIAQAQAGMAQAEQQRIQIGQTARADAGEELARVEAAINESRVNRADAGDAFNRSEVRAVADGTVDKLAFAATGEVVRPAETILEIVPRQDGQVFDGLVMPSDIDRVAVGQSARIRLSAFNQATTPELNGEVTFVSADPVTLEATGGRFYRVRVKLSGEDEETAKALALVSGMPAELFIETGSRSMLSFLTKPLVDQFQRAFRN